LLYIHKNSYFGVVGLQTNDTLIVVNDEFAATEEEELQKAKFIAKPREELTSTTLLKFNGGVISLMDDKSVILT